MAVYLDITKMSETAQSAVYRYENTDGESGEFSTSKETGESTLLRPMKGEQNQQFFKRAARKVYLAWQNKRDLPEKTQWAS